MTVITTEKLSPTVGALVAGVDRDQLVSDESLPGWCLQALEAGLSMLGENRVQEALGKMDAVPDAEWHLIGHLQTNKVRQAAGSFALIHSIDSVRLAASQDKCR